MRPPLVLLFLCGVPSLLALERSFRDYCVSPKLREIVMEAIGLYPDQYSFQAKQMKETAEEQFGNYWSAVRRRLHKEIPFPRFPMIINGRGGYAMSSIQDRHKNTSCEILLFDTFYWLGRTS